MKTLTAYRVLTNSPSHCAKSGDIFWLSDNGDFVNTGGGGWLGHDEYEIDFEYEIAKDYCVLTIGGDECLIYIEGGDNPLKKN